MLIGSAQPDHLYLSDFGLSKQRVSSAPLTLTGQFLGTLDYMAPEQIEGHPLDGSADLYALACTAFEMLAGQPPYKRDEGLAVMWAQVSAPVPSLRALRPDLPPAVDQVMSRALAKTPDARYPSCTAFARALSAACGLGGGQAGEAGADMPPLRRPADRAGADPGVARGVAHGDVLGGRSATRSPRPPGPANRCTGPPRPGAGPAPATPAASSSWPPPPPASTRYQPGGGAARQRRGRRWPLVVSVVVLLAIVGVGVRPAPPQVAGTDPDRSTRRQATRPPRPRRPRRARPPPCRPTSRRSTPTTTQGVGARRQEHRLVLLQLREGLQRHRQGQRRRWCPWWATW